MGVERGHGRPRYGLRRPCWADLVVVPLVLVLSVSPLLWFGHHWTLSNNDTARYLLAGSQIVSGTVGELNTVSEFNGGHGPALPALVGLLILPFGRDTGELVWALRLLALLNPMLAYLLVKRISTPSAGLLAASLVALLAYNVEAEVAINIDSLQATFYLLSLLLLLHAIDRGGSFLPLLSGLLLGAAILTKETAVVDLPLALLAVLLLDWNPRGAVWHYLGVVLVCLPWWIWAYLATGEVYLVGTLPEGMRAPILIAVPILAVLAVLAVLAYTPGVVGRSLSVEGQRRAGGRLVVLLWTVALACLLLSTASHALGGLTFADLGSFLGHLLSPVLAVVPALLAACGYAAYRASRGEGAWTILALALLFQAPVVLLLTVQRWAERQFLVPQVLVFCILAALVVALGTVARRGRGSHQMVAVGAVVALSTLFVASSAQGVRTLLAESFPPGASGTHGITPQTARMADWMGTNVPEGEHVLIVSEPALNVPQANYLMFLDGGKHEWTRLQLDQGICQPRPNVQANCDPDQNAISRIPPDALWVQSIGGGCRFISLSASRLTQQTRQDAADYVAIPGNREFPAILGLPPALQASGAFDVAHANLILGGRTGTKQGVVLLESSGEGPKAIPTITNATTALSLRRCG